MQLEHGENAISENHTTFRTSHKHCTLVHHRNTKHIPSSTVRVPSFLDRWKLKVGKTGNAAERISDGEFFFYYLQKIAIDDG